MFPFTVKLTLLFAMSIHLFSTRLVVLFSLLATFVGCSSVTSVPGKKVVSAGEILIENGMPASELIELLGEPEEVRDIEAPREGFEVWVYTQVVKSTEYGAPDTEEIPFFDPLTGVYKPIVQAVFSPETSTVTVETQFLIADGFVVGWKRQKDVDSSYY